MDLYLNYTGMLGHNFVGNWLTLYNVGQFITSSNFKGTKICGLGYPVKSTNVNPP